MGIQCKIGLHRPPDGKFTPNGIISGVINYSVDKSLALKDITVSLKGTGYLEIRVSHRTRSGQNDHQYTKIYEAKEEYLRMENSVLETGIENVIPSGSYEIPFMFLLPKDIPASLDYSFSDLKRRVKCKIKYNVRIHFKRAGKFTFDKKFKQDIMVTRDEINYPRYPTEMKVYSESKKLFHVIKKNSVDLKVKMFNSIIAPGGSVLLEYELSNNSDLQLKGVKVKLIEMYTFTTQYWTEVQYNDVPIPSIKSGSVAMKKTEIIPLTFDIPSDAVSIEGSNFVRKDYVLQFTVQTPSPHRNLVLNVPFQVGFKPGEYTATHPVPEYVKDNPPSYWEAMTEDKSEDA